jgi:K+-sensing histidine kinase KdpD
VSGNLAADLRRREREIEGLYQFSRRLAACYTMSDLIRATQSYLSESLMRPTVVIEGELLGGASAADTVAPRDVQNRARALVSSGELAAQRIFDAATRHVWLVRPVSIGATRYVVLVDLGTSAIGTKRRLNRRLDAILADAANSLVRLDLAEALEQLKLQGQSDTLKSALVATMSHELRNPLVSIVGAASVLEQMTEVRQSIRARSLVETVHDEAVRLDDNIKNLIDAAIITTGGEPAGAELCDPVDMIHAAIELKRIQLAGHKVEVTLAPDLPLVRVQSALMENAVGQLLDNAAKYSPANSTIRIEGRTDKEWLTLSVSDRGAGLTAAEQTNVGQRSFRGARHAAIRGSGLGLWIASTFIAANGGRLDAESPGPGLGTTIRIRLPATHGMGQD